MELSSLNLTGLTLITMVLVGTIIALGILISNPKKYILGFQDHECKEKLSPKEESQFEIN